MGRTKKTLVRCVSISTRKTCKTNTLTLSISLVSLERLKLAGERNDYAIPNKKFEKQGYNEFEKVDQYGRVTKGPVTLKNGATY